MDWDDADLAGADAEEEAAQFPTDRPGLVTFAAVMMFVLAGFQGVWAVLELFNTAWIAGTTYGDFNGFLWIWATLDILLAGLTLFVGFALLAGSSVAYIYGLCVTSISA